ncbi:MAG: hypothetical protein H6Q00_87 [Holophagaceae bacterium]|nr:hypothetical protein [Holophagaceae bacterium]
MSQGLIQGSMRGAPLPDIIQLVCQGGKSGVFHVTEDPKRARIFLREGRIVHAISREAEGLEALYTVALWLDGRYHFEEGPVEVPTSITKSNPAILMELHRRMDEWRVINQKIASLELYPTSVLLPDETPQGVNPREARLLSNLTGYYNVAELAETLGKPVLSVAKDLYGLIMAGHVILKGVRSGRKPELPEIAVSEPLPTAAVNAEPLPAPEPLPSLEPENTVPSSRPPTAPLADPAKTAKLTAFAQRIAQTAKSALPAEYHDMVARLHSKATQQLIQGEGPDAVKGLALAVSRGAVEAGCPAEIVKELNAHLKALFSR